MRHQSTRLAEAAVLAAVRTWVRAVTIFDKNQTARNSNRLAVAETKLLSADDKLWAIQRNNDLRYKQRNG